MKRLYRLVANKDFNESFLYDIDEDYTNKTDYINAAKKYTARYNKKYGTNYTWVKIFGKPTYTGWTNCGWVDDPE